MLPVPISVRGRARYEEQKGKETQNGNASGRRNLKSGQGTFVSSAKEELIQVILPTVIRCHMAFA
jgi:hypothetical protein